MTLYLTCAVKQKWGDEKRNHQVFFEVPLLQLSGVVDLVGNLSYLQTRS